ncbi:reverse transcriptase domain-containing protein [Caerostris darwini]|uniref:Reverse transcriptase domain-containing protein n=1 Tax=Caerostris darwini TaxID=1538125 RepID=A0AAV4Q5S2_9ARAC|nr:reverse transcriptase domain-containing protein [Caerostris darwini]
MVCIHGELSRPFEIVNGVRQRDALACLLFTVTLEKVIRDSGINTRATIFNKSVQILAYADDIDIARYESTLRESFLVLEGSAGDAGLTINEGKTKYMF